MSGIAALNGQSVLAETVIAATLHCLAGVVGLELKNEEFAMSESRGELAIGRGSSRHNLVFGRSIAS
jgi:hypothetical protein